MIDIRDRQVLEKLMQVEHWEEGRSLRAIERNHGLTKTSLVQWCCRHGIPYRSRIDSLRAFNATEEGRKNRPRGENHKWYGMRKETSELMQRHSERMTNANPATDYVTMAKMSAGRAIYLRENPTTREQMVLNLLPLGTTPGMIFQYPVGIYIIDFAFPGCRVGLEIDGSSHNRSERIAHDAIRNQALIEEGWILLRHAISLWAPHPKGWNLSRVGHILEALVPDLHLIYPEPSSRRSQYGVLISCQEYPTGIRVYTPNDPRLCQLAHRIRHAAPAALMREDEHANLDISNIEHAL
jgi:very-short-patch-repair endonuclease